SALTTKKLMERRGIMNMKELSDHYVICGWKNAMNQILSEIVYQNPMLNLKKIIIIANIEPEDIELFYQQYPDYQQITIIRGEHYNEALLKKANVQKANRVIILSDESTSSTPSEADSKTVMAAMAINSISNNIKVSAEIMDKKFEKYLLSAHVEEIIYTNEYNKVLIANSLTQVGITKIINNLLNAQVPGFITTSKIPSSYIGRSFSDLREHYKGKSKALLIGLLENVGNYIQRKKEAIREAQKTADITKLISNLNSAKKMENYMPNINPDDDYKIPYNSMAVLIEREKKS
ncbi:MAG: NAD-binding protein, partial [Brevinematales bacterium]